MGRLPSYLTRPPNTNVAGKLPLIVMPHGGPEARDTLGYDRLAQVLATHGYLVLQPNYRGSAGYGLEFRNAGRKQWGRRMQQDIEDGARALIASGQADPSRVCILGGSYGGYAALIGGALTPDLYKCVVSFAGVSDLTKMLDYETPSRITYDYWTQVIGDPKADRDLILEGSPVSYAADYRPPVLLIHGEVDRTVPIEQSEVMEAALKRAGKSVKFVRVPGGHGDQNEENWNLIMNEMIDFLKAHIAG
jgi:dipeptidyl aminopeptidase/acylaminoacyl peptidase